MLHVPAAEGGQFAEGGGGVANCIARRNKRGTACGTL
jgi:hypothetical protein